MEHSSLLFAPPLGCVEPVKALACHHPKVLAVFSSGRMVLFDVTTANHIVKDTPSTPHSFTCACCLGGTSSSFLAGTTAGRLVLIDTTGAILQEIEAHNGYRVYSLASNAEGCVVSCGRDGSIVSWKFGETVSSEVVYTSRSWWRAPTASITVGTTEDRVFHVTLNKQGRELHCAHAATGGEELEPPLRLPFHLGEVRHMASDAHRVAICARGTPGHVHIADFATRNVHAVSVPGGHGRVAVIRGDAIFVGTKEGHVTLLGGTERWACKSGVSALHVEWAHHYFVTGDKGGEVRLWSHIKATTRPEALSCGVDSLSHQEAAMAYLVLMDEAKSRSDRRAAKRAEMSYALASQRVEEDMFLVATD